MRGFVAEIIQLYSTAKNSLAAATGATEDLLHIHVGLLIFVASALLLQRRMRSPIPLLLVALFASLNEIVDWLAPAPQPPLEWLVDLANTIFWPAILFLIARRGRGSDRIPEKQEE